MCVRVWWSRRSHGLSYCLSCRASSLWSPLGLWAKQKWPRKTGHTAVETSEYQGSNSVHISLRTAWLCLHESFKHSRDSRGQTSSHLTFVLWITSAFFDLSVHTVLYVLLVYTYEGTTCLYTLQYVAYDHTVHMGINMCHWILSPWTGWKKVGIFENRIKWI